MNNRGSAISPWEWLAGAVSALLVAGILGALAVHARRDRTPPDLTVVVDGIAPRSGLFLVRFTIANAGNTTAAGVVVRGELTANDVVEQTEVTFDYVPDGSKRQGGLIFHNNPAEGHLSLRPLGYREP